MKNILIDLLFCLGWLIICGIAGGVFNEFRTKPLPLVYSPPGARLNQEVDRLRIPSPPTQNPQSATNSGDVARSEMQKIVADHTSIIVDARPAIFYRFGHIPSAISLPRDDFDNKYGDLQSTLEPQKEQSIVVYCSDEECHDSELVSEALRKLGYKHVRRYPGGWGDWQAAHGAEEK